MLRTCSVAIAFFALAYAFAPRWEVLVVLVYFHGLFWSGLLSASAAYMTGLIPNERRTEGIGYWGMATVLAIAFAPALGLAVYSLGWKALCASVGILGLAMAAIAWNLEPDPPRVAPHGPFFSRNLVEWRVLAPSLSLFLCSFGYGGVTSFVAMWTEKNGLAPRGLFFTVFSLTVLVLRPVLGATRPHRRAASSSCSSGSRRRRSPSTPSRRRGRSASSPVFSSARASETYIPSSQRT